MSLSIHVQFPIVAKESAAVTSVQFSPAEPHDFAVTAGAKVTYRFNKLPWFHCTLILIIITHCIT